MLRQVAPSRSPMSGRAVVNVSAGIDRLNRGLAFTDYPGTASGPAVVLLPSLGLTRRSWQAAAEALSGAFRILNVDPPGHGDSPLPDHFLTIRGHADQCIALLDDLGIEKFIPIGNSMGASVSLELASSHPDRVMGLAMVGAFVAETEGERHEWLVSRSRSMLTPDGRLRAMPAEVAAMVFGHYDASRHSYILGEHIACAGSIASDLWSLYSYDSAAALDLLQQPSILSIYGEADYLRQGSGAAIRRRLPTVTEAVIPGGSHLTPVDQPQALADVLRDWLGHVVL